MASVTVETRAVAKLVPTGASVLSTWSTLMRAPLAPMSLVDTMLRMFVTISEPLPRTPLEKTLPAGLTMEVVPIGLSILPLTVTSGSVFSTSTSVGATVRWMWNWSVTVLAARSAIGCVVAL